MNICIRQASVLWGLAAALFIVDPVSGAVAAETYKFDKGHTEIIFEWNHAGVSMQHGEFTKADGVLVLDPDNVDASTMNVTIDASSVSTGVDALDTHLKSSDYLDVAKFPTITFQSTSVTKTGDTTADVSGDLVIHGVKKSATLKVSMTHRGSHPVGKYLAHYKGSWMAFAAETKIKHLEFGVGAFPVGPSDAITVRINTEMKYQQ